MRKILVTGSFLIVLFLCGHSLEAQRFRAAALAGFNMSQIDGDRLGGYNQLGLNAGIKVAAVLGERWQLSLEMLLAQQGSSRVKNDLTSSIYENIRLNLVETPVMINFQDWKFQASTGISYARLVSYRARAFTGEDISDQEEYHPDLFYFLIGVTYHFNDRWGLNVRWSRSLNNLQAREGGQSLFSRLITIRAEYAF